MSIDWRDGSPVTRIDLGSGRAQLQRRPPYLPRQPTGGSTYPITVTVTTSDNQSATASIPVTVTNASPTVPAYA